MPAATARAISGERAMKSRGLMPRMCSTIEVALVSARLRPYAASDRLLRIGVTTSCSLRACSVQPLRNPPWFIEFKGRVLLGRPPGGR